MSFQVITTEDDDYLLWEDGSVAVWEESNQGFVQEAGGGAFARGSSSIKDGPNGYSRHPVMKFQVNLLPLQNVEYIGPITNLRSTAVPVLRDLQQQRGLRIPGIERELRHGDEFILEGPHATSTVRNFTNGQEGDFTSTPLVLVKRY